MTQTTRPANRLAGSTSPYLLQHAHNPVDWYPWCDEAFARARSEGKPIFLSIGYAACHWCHVMERESFENDAIASFLNENFVSIKVDREERPDLDEIYMACVQMLTGAGGWPMTVFLTPDGRPFYGGTYFPPEDRWGRPGFLTLLASVAQTWRRDRDKIDENAQILTAAIGEIAGAVAGGGEAPTFDLVRAAADQLLARLDPVWGGFGSAPKFPPAMALNLMLRVHRHDGDPRLLDAVELTLRRMASGGIYDQIGGGFHRYSVDERWHAPHFEKMLYDNALLAPVYLDAWRVTGDDAYRRVGCETLDYLMRDMTDGNGGLWSAQDADSEGVEGKYYIWTPEEIVDVLGEENGRLFAEAFDVRAGGNWQEGGGASILNRPEPLEELAARYGEEPDALRDRLDALRARLLAARQRRVPPLTDDKVLAAWNGMAIAALAQGTQATGDARYVRAAARAARMVLGEMRGPDGGLLRASRAGRAHIPAFLEDYAHLACGLIDLYETTFDPGWLAAADELAGGLLARFGDGAAGGFYSTDGNDPTVLVRMRDVLDGATPSGTAAAVVALLRLSRLLDRPAYRAAVERVLTSLADSMRIQPAAHHHLLCGLFDLLEGPDVALIAGEDQRMAAELTRVVWATYAPGRAIAATPGCSIEEAAPVDGSAVEIALLSGRGPIDGHATAYVCRDGTCRMPVTDPDSLRRDLLAGGTQS